MSSRPRQFTVNGGFGSSHFSQDDADNRSDDDLDIDFSITESGRTVAHVIAGLKEVNGSSNDPPMTSLDISISASGRSVVEDLPPRSPPAVESALSKSVTTETPLAANYRTTRSAAKSITVERGDQEQDESGSYESSASAFVSGLIDNGNGGDNVAISHTPPAGSSYETRHFGKRPRTGSVSGRLRSASDLEDKGIIDRSQKGVLKDLIISGDEALQAALDKYEKGDRSQLEGMIKSGLLAQKLPVEMDLLGDLDLDFLTVDDATIGSMGNQNLEHPGGKKALPPIVSGVPSSGNSVDFADGIGDLDLSIGGGDSVTRTSRSNSIDLDSFRFRSNSIRSEFEFRSRSNSFAIDLRDRSNSIATLDFRDRSNSIALQDARDRSNSLAYGALVNEPTAQEAATLHQRWMDRPVPGKEADSPVIRKGRAAAAAAPAVGGIGASLAEYNSRTQASPIGNLTKAQLAEEKRRDRQRKKDEKEREKREAKERRDREKQEKREQKELEKQVKKNHKKVLKPKMKVEEEEEVEKVIESGSGRPRSMSDPNLKSTIDANGLLQVERPDGWVGAYSPESRRLRIDRFMEKRNHRVWTKSVKYDVRKNFADSRLRVKGRFVKKEDELLMRELMSLT